MKDWRAMNKLKTIDLKGKSYATVPERLRQFREDSPNSSIETSFVKNDDGTATFKALVISDLSKDDSKRATGHSYGKLNGDKSFEKLETISVGRALGLLGYLANGEVASFEEMEDFYLYKEEKKQKAMDKLRNAKTMPELKKAWDELGNEMSDKEVIKIKEEMKEQCK